MRRAAESILASRVVGRPAVVVSATRIATGAVFVGFGLGKFVSHTSEVDSFDRYGLPSPDTFVYLIGGLEIVGGAMLIAGLVTRLIALALAGDMVGAVVVSGIGQGEVISLMLAPVLLLAMLVLAATGAGPRSLDLLLLRRWQRRSRDRSVRSVRSA